LPEKLPFPAGRATWSDVNARLTEASEALLKPVLSLEEWQRTRSRLLELLYLNEDQAVQALYVKVKTCLEVVDAMYAHGLQPSVWWRYRLQLHLEKLASLLKGKLLQVSREYGGGIRTE